MQQTVDLRRIADELAIREVHARYCRAVDRCDLDLLKSVYWEEATDDHIVYSGNAHGFADFIIPMLRDNLECTQHLIGNCWLKIEGDTACAETYVQAYHRVRGGGDVVVGGRYLDRLERRASDWKIAERKFVLDWEQNSAPLLGGADAVSKLLAIDRRHQGEDSYRLFSSGTMRD